MHSREAFESWYELDEYTYFCEETGKYISSVPMLEHLANRAYIAFISGYQAALDNITKDTVTNS